MERVMTENKKSVDLSSVPVDQLVEALAKHNEGLQIAAKKAREERKATSDKRKAEKAAREKAIERLFS